MVNQSLSLILITLLMSRTVYCPGPAVTGSTLNAAKLKFRQPINDPAKPKYHGECIDILTILPDFPQNTSIITALLQHCISRFRALHSAHTFYHQSAKLPKFMQRHLGIEVNKPLPEQSASRSGTVNTLIILDLDETIMDQRTCHAPIDYLDGSLGTDFWDSVNRNGLVLDINHLESNDERYLPNTARCVSIGVFRRDFMRFLRFTQTQSSRTRYDLMLYSKAAPDAVIFQTVVMEIFYNFVVESNIEFDSWFQFLFVLAREDQRVSVSDRMLAASKSLQIVSDLLTNREYKYVVIVDDMANAVWSGTIPKRWIETKTAVLGIWPPAFTVHPRLNGRRILTDGGAFAELLRRRNMDRTFQDVIRILESLPKRMTALGAFAQSQLRWIKSM